MNAGGGKGTGEKSCAGGFNLPFAAAAVSRFTFGKSPEVMGKGTGSGACPISHHPIEL